MERLELALAEETQPADLGRTTEAPTISTLKMLSAMPLGPTLDVLGAETGPVTEHSAQAGGQRPDDDSPSGTQRSKFVVQSVFPASQTALTSETTELDNLDGEARYEAELGPDSKHASLGTERNTQVTSGPSQEQCSMHRRSLRNSNGN